MTFWEEIYGCVKNIGIPYETVMNMPVYIRRIWISRHNLEQEKLRNDMENKEKGGIVSGEALNSYAGLEQKKTKTNYPV